MKLTSRYRIPARVRAFVPEHHGTRLVTYFYRKASIQDPMTDPEKFRYPGPKPQTRETAMVRGRGAWGGGPGWGGYGSPPPPPPGSRVW